MILRFNIRKIREKYNDFCVILPMAKIIESVTCKECKTNTDKTEAALIASRPRTRTNNMNSFWLCRDNIKDKQKKK